MSAWTDLPAAAGDRLGLPRRPNAKDTFGEKDGLLVHVAAVQLGESVYIQETVRYLDAARDDAVREAIGRSPELDAAGIKAKQVQVKDGIAAYRHPKKAFSTPSPEEIAGEVEALVKAVKSAVPAPPTACRLCGSTSAGGAILLNGIVDRVCPSCIERLQHEARRAAEEYEKRTMNLPLALVAAAVLAVVGAVLWAGIEIATDRMFWAVGIGIGALVGYGTAKAAGKGGLPVQVIGAVFTVLSVLLGELLYVAYHLHQMVKQAGGNVDWNWIFTQSIEILKDNGADTVFALVAGLVGAFIAIGAASKPKHDVKVEGT